jgi:hypothetical protein
MPSANTRSEIRALEAKARELEAQASAAEESGDAKAAAGLFEQAAKAWFRVGAHCERVGEDPAGEAELFCWEGDAVIAEVEAELRAARLIRASDPAHAEELEIDAADELRWAASMLEHCGRIRLPLHDPDRAREPLAKAEGCLRVRRRMMERLHRRERRPNRVQWELLRTRWELALARRRSRADSRKSSRSPKARRSRAGAARRRRSPRKR